MCGIAGVQHRDAARPVSAEALRAMTAAMVHRGPDDEGHEHFGGTALGFRRLSIVDLGGGHQPLANEDGRVWVVMNGEIFNHAELRDELAARGHTFRTRSDTEVLVHGWEEWGEELPRRLVGMFAFAVFDRRDGRDGGPSASGALFLARDRFGQKPLFWHQGRDCFLFASELKPLLAHPDAPREIGRAALRKYLALEMVPWPHAIVEGVHKLAPGHSMIVRCGVAEPSRPFHELVYSPKTAIGEEEAREELWRRLVKSTSRQLMADVPLGVFLSGGIDSTAIVAAMRAADPAREILTFSIGFEDRSFDESPFAAEVAAHFGTRHHVRIFDAAALRASLDDLPRLLDEPMADASILPTWMLSKFARETVTVALGGDGGDEILAGYDTFTAHRLARRYAAVVPRWADAILLGGVRLLPVSTANMSFGFRARQFLRGVRRPESERTWGWMSSFLPGEIAELTGEGPSAVAAIGQDVFGDIGALDERVRGEHWIDRHVHEMCRTYLAEGVLTKVDRASMAASLEVRAPFLDHELADWVNRLPPAMKMRGGSKKHILREALRGRVPPGVLTRPKKGFGVPLAARFRTDAKDWCAGRLDDLDRVLPGRFVPGVVRRLFDEHVAGAADHRKKLWTLCCLSVWADGMERK